MRSIINTLDTIALFVLCTILATAFYYQLFLHELPCALCVLQRMGLSLIAIGLILNLKFGYKPAHYYIVILSATINSFMALTQVLLHIVPGTGNYGDAVFGIHMYTWNFIISMGFVLYGTVAGLLSSGASNHKFNQIAKYIVILFIILLVANIFSVFAVCGVNMCPSDPQQYWLFN